MYLYGALSLAACPIPYCRRASTGFFAKNHRKPPPAVGCDPVCVPCPPEDLAEVLQKVDALRVVRSLHEGVGDSEMQERGRL
jgi:hypothetical protein